jgi:hypothetical protein
MFVTVNIKTFHAHVLQFIITRRYNVKNVVKLTKNKLIAIYLYLQTKLPCTLPMFLIEYTYNVS